MGSKLVWRGVLALGVAGAIGAAAVAVTAGDASEPTSVAAPAPAATATAPTPADGASSDGASSDEPSSTSVETAGGATTAPPTAPTPPPAPTAASGPATNLSVSPSGAVVPSSASLGTPAIALPQRTVSPTPAPPTPRATTPSHPTSPPTTAPTTTSTTAPAARHAALGPLTDVAIGNAPWQLYGGTLTFPVTLSAPANPGESVDWATSGGTAIPGVDFDYQEGTIFFNPGDTTAEISVDTYGSGAWAPDRTIDVVLSNGIDLHITTGTGTGTLASDKPLYVDTTTDAVDDDPGDGVCHTAADQCSLRAATQELNQYTTVNPDAQVTIYLAGDQTYTLTIPGADEDQSATGDLDLTNTAPNISFLISYRRGSRPTIDGNGLDRVLDVHGAKLTLWTINVVNGITGNAVDTSEDGGGGIRSLGVSSSVMLALDSRVADNQARYGGGVYSEGTLSVNWASVELNTAFETGGGALSTGSLVLNQVFGDPLIGGNHAGSCAGGYAALGTLETRLTTVINNTAAGCAGGVLVGQGATATFQGGHVDHNTAGTWAGGVLVQGDTSITGTVVHANSALYGAGLTQTQGAVTISEASVDSNTAIGSGSAAGGLLLCDGTGTATTTVDRNTTITANSAESAGGVLINDSVTTFRGQVTNSTATAFGGGVLNISDAHSQTLDKAVITNNAAGYGGGVYQIAGSPGLDITDTSINSNSASTLGAGLAAAGPVTVARSTIAYNTNGSGAVAAAAPVSFTNSTVDTNSGIPGILVLASPAGSVQLDSSTVSHNAGGIVNEGTAAAVTLFNTIVAEQTSGDDCTGATTSLGYNIDTDITCSLSGTGDQPSGVVGLQGLADNGGYTLTDAFVSSSDAEDSGPATGYPATDQRGVTRPQGSAPDCGAYELVTVPI